jgi:ribosomal protein S13
MATKGAHKLFQLVLRDNANIAWQLTRVKGIGPFQSRTLCQRFGLNPQTKVRDVQVEIMPMIQVGRASSACIPTAHVV